MRAEPENKFFFRLGINLEEQIPKFFDDIDFIIVIKYIITYCLVIIKANQTITRPN